jgi:hypothetical protein
MAPCSLVGGHQRFGRSYRFHPHPRIFAEDHNPHFHGRKSMKSHDVDSRS